MQDFCIDNTHICIYKECAEISINIPDVMQVVQFKVLYFIILPELLHQLS